MQLEELTTVRTGRPLVIGHRGLAWDYPENTLISFDAAVAAGADLVELDYRPTRDGVLVCAHDPTLWRYQPAADHAMRSSAFSCLTWAQLSALDFGAWKGEQFRGVRLARLSEVVERFTGPHAGRAILLIEHKEGTPQQLLTMLQALNAVQRVVVQSFDWAFLAQLHTLEPRLLLAALGAHAITDDRLDAIRATGARMVHWIELSLRAAEVKRLHDAGLPVWAYTLNSETAYRGARDIGLDGVTTDRCNLARKLLAPLAAGMPDQP